MAVSFCYFLTQLAAEGRKAENLILVIDDPISSLDTAARTYAYSLMTRMTKKCAQVISRASRSDSAPRLNLTIQALGWRIFLGAGIWKRIVLPFLTR